ncbi:RusA family crossover junction endodeoxyribonuclease [Pseudovibrio brasiliensis]|uniref:RusA family crossover junction endodeoxyribonuclease n=1 Tax=Pseudovibrio brasiliensis TaxID=1898042 RepID=A0ABX8AS91_9HYPH|nr:RusA family crossover junction endodeoxyribonuclease [Pseudovibrio brasiliensis]
MEIDFPIEFLVKGTPVSLQAKRAEAREEWKEIVKAASTTAIETPHMVSDKILAVTIYYFPEEAMQGDIDNIVKPILDALNRHIYFDDNQVERLVVQKFEPDRVFEFQNVTQTLQDALEGKPPVLYIKISDNPHEELR